MPVDDRSHYLGCYLGRPLNNEPYTCLCGLPWGVPCKPSPAAWSPDIIGELRALDIANGAVMDPHELFGWMAYVTGRDVGLHGDRAWAGWLAAEMVNGADPCAVAVAPGSAP